MKTHQTESIDKSQAAQLQMNVVDRKDDVLPPNSATSNPLEMPVLQNFPGNENQMNTQSPSRQRKSPTPSAPKIASESFEDLKGKIKEDLYEMKVFGFKFSISVSTELGSRRFLNISSIRIEKPLEEGRKRVRWRCVCSHAKDVVMISEIVKR